MRTGKQFWAKVILIGLALTTLLPVYCSAATLFPATPTVSDLGSSSACHHSAPSGPAVPSPQKCCFAGRTPRAAISARYVPPPADAVGAVENSSTGDVKFLRDATPTPLPDPSSPPGLQVLRI